MPSIINTNISSLTAQRQLSASKTAELRSIFSEGKSDSRRDSAQRSAEYTAKNAEESVIGTRS